MRDQPTGEQLLATARALLRDELIPALPADKRHSALMIANAMAIAARQLKNGNDAEREELAALGELLAATAPGAQAAGLRAALCQGNRQLCRWIREGRADAGALREGVHRHLLRTIRHKVAESNPKALGTAA
jgi:hypothetical protein